MDFDGLLLAFMNLPSERTQSHIYKLKVFTH
jgi:hypothetical protein